MPVVILKLHPGLLKVRQLPITNKWAAETLRLIPGQTRGRNVMAQNEENKICNSLNNLKNYPLSIARKIIEVRGQFLLPLTIIFDRCVCASVRICVGTRVYVCVPVNLIRHPLL